MNLSTIEHVWNMMGRHLICLVFPPTTLALVCQQIQNEGDYVSQEDICHSYDHIHVRIQVGPYAQVESAVYECEVCWQPLSLKMFTCRCDHLLYF